MTGRLAVGSLNLKLSRFTLNYCHLKGALELCFSAISSFSYAVYSMPADGWYPLVLVLTLSIKLNGCFVFLIFHFPTASWNTIVCHAVVQWMLQTPWANMTSKKRSPRLPLSRDSFPPPLLVFSLCPHSCLLQMSTQQRVSVNQPAQNQPNKTRLIVWSLQFPVSASHTTASALQCWRGMRGKGENDPIFAEVAYSLHINTASKSILLAYLGKVFYVLLENRLPKDYLICS